MIRQTEPSGKWADTIVPLIDAAQKASSIKRPYAGTEFTLAAGDFVLFPGESGREELFRVTKLSEGQIAMVRHFDGRRMDDIKKSKDVKYKTGSSLVKAGGRKMLVTYLGELRRSGG